MRWNLPKETSPARMTCKDLDFGEIMGTRIHGEIFMNIPDLDVSRQLHGVCLARLCPTGFVLIQD